MAKLPDGPGSVAARLLQLSPGDGSSCQSPEAGREPVLNDLLDDPIMQLLWRSEGLEPSQARATVRELLAFLD